MLRVAFGHGGGDWRQLVIAATTTMTAVAQGGEVIMFGGVSCEKKRQG
jgi:hypothetical protein